MKKSAIIVNVIAFLLTMLFDVLYMVFGRLYLKATASIFFVLLGAFNLVIALKNKTELKKFCILILVGLFFAMLGDIILNIHFISGAVLFAVGHIFFFTSYCCLTKQNWKDFLCSAIIFVPSLLVITLVPAFDFGGILMELVCVVYALIISCMVGKALSNYITNRNQLSLIILIGSVLFFFSDLMLLLNVFGGVGVWASVLCLSTYYPAEILLASSIIATTYKGVKNDKE